MASLVLGILLLVLVVCAVVVVADIRGGGLTAHEERAAGTGERQAQLTAVPARPVWESYPRIPR